MVRITRAKGLVSYPSGCLPWPFGSHFFFLFSASFYHVSSLQFFWGFVWFGLVLFRFFLRWSRCLSADTRYSARKRKRKRSGKNATSIMACQLSKPFVCCALELTSPTFSQPKPATPPCPQFSAAFFIPILLWVHLFFFCFVGYSDSSRTHLLFFLRGIVLEWRDRETTHNYWDMPLSFFFLFFIYLFSLDFWILAFPFFFSTISFQFVLLFFTFFFFLFFILSRLFWLPCLSPLFLLRLSRHGRWLINHVAASIEKPSPVVSDAVPLFRLPFPAFCRLARSSCFPESTGTRERNKKKNDKTKRKQENSLPPTKKNWFEMCIFFS